MEDYGGAWQMATRKKRGGLGPRYTGSSRQSQFEAREKLQEKKILAVSLSLTHLAQP